MFEWLPFAPAAPQIAPQCKFQPGPAASPASMERKGCFESGSAIPHARPCRKWNQHSVKIRRPEFAARRVCGLQGCSEADVRTGSGSAAAVWTGQAGFGFAGSWLQRAGRTQDFLCAENLRLRHASYGEYARLALVNL